MTTTIRITHPAWCDAAWCDASAGPAEVRHRSAPITFRGRADDVQFQLFRYRDGDRAPGYLMRVRHLGVDDDVEFAVHPEDDANVHSAIAKLSHLA